MDVPFALLLIWRDGRVVEGAPLLREYRVKNLIEGSNPSLSESYFFEIAPVAQLDRAPGYELGGREFESLRARFDLLQIKIFTQIHFAYFLVR